MILDTTMLLRTSRLQWQRYIYNAFDTLYDKTHKRDRACSLLTATPPFFTDRSNYCATCNRWFLSEKYFQNYLTLKGKGKLVCQWRQVCRNCSYTVTGDSKHECFKRFCIYCNKYQLSGHFCLCMFSLTRSAHGTSKSMMGPLSIFRTSYVLSRCVPNVKRWMT
jgi:hypothetical protein